LPRTPRRVLHVDDNAGDRLLVSMALAALEVGCVVESAEGGAAALDLLGLGRRGREAPPPELIIVDINMPGMDGFEFVDRLAGHPHLAEASILFLSTSRSPFDAVRAVSLGNSLFAVKPLCFEHLCDTIGLALKGLAGEVELPSAASMSTMSDADEVAVYRD